MKKSFLSGLILGILVASVSSAVVANTDNVREYVSAYLNSDVKVKLNGEPVEFTNTPLNYKDTNYFSVRDLGEMLGLDVNWNEAERMIELDVKNDPNSLSTTNTEAPDKIVSMYNFNEWLDTGTVKIQLSNFKTSIPSNELLEVGVKSRYSFEFSIQTSKDDYTSPNGTLYLTMYDNNLEIIEWIPLRISDHIETKLLSKNIIYTFEVVGNLNREDYDFNMITMEIPEIGINNEVSWIIN